MIFLHSLTFFIFGTIIGSFINVVVLRYNTGLSFLSGRSKCFSCGKTLTSGELIPLFSFLLLGGKCSSCKSKISYQYPLVEFFTGIVFLGLFLQFGISILLFFYLIAVSFLMVIAVYDLKHKIIPDGMVFLFTAVSVLIFFCTGNFHSISEVFYSPDFWAGPILFSFFATLWLISGGRWMGFGDAKLALGVGFILGLSGGVFAIISAFWIGALWGIMIIVLSKLHILKHALGMKSEVPFAPFIIGSLFLQIFTGWNLITLMYSFNF